MKGPAACVVALRAMSRYARAKFGIVSNYFCRIPRTLLLKRHFYIRENEYTPEYSASVYEEKSVRPYADDVRACRAAPLCCTSATYYSHLSHVAAGAALLRAGDDDVIVPYFRRFFPLCYNQVNVVSKGVEGEFRWHQKRQRLFLFRLGVSFHIGPLPESTSPPASDFYVPLSAEPYRAQTFTPCTMSCARIHSKRAQRSALPGHGEP